MVSLFIHKHGTFLIHLSSAGNEGAVESLQVGTRLQGSHHTILLTVGGAAELTSHLKS